MWFIHADFVSVASELPADHPHQEFYRIGRTELARADAAIASLLEFAHPHAPVTRRSTVGALFESVAALATGTLGPRLILEKLDAEAAGTELSADIEQTRRALLTLLLCDGRAREVRLGCRRQHATLLVADLVHNVGRPTHAWTKVYTKAMGFYDRIALSRAIRWTAFPDRAAARRSVDALLALPFERLVVGHGTPITTGAKEALAAACSWLPAGPAETR